MFTEEHTTSVSASAVGMEFMSVLSAGVAPLSMSALNPPMKYAHGFCCGVEGAGVFDVVVFAAGSGDDSDGCDGDAFVYDGDAQLGFDSFAHTHQVFSAGGDFVVDFLAGYRAVGVGAVEQGDAHGDGADI